MQHLMERLRQLGRRPDARKGMWRAAVTVTVLAAVCAPPAIAMQSDSGGVASRPAPASVVDSSPRHGAPRETTRTRPVAGGGGEAVAPPVRLEPIAVHATALGAAAGVLRGSAWRGDYTAPGLARRADLAITVGPAEDGGDAIAGEVAFRVVRDGDTFNDGERRRRRAGHGPVRRPGVRLHRDRHLHRDGARRRDRWALRAAWRADHRDAPWSLARGTRVGRGRRGARAVTRTVTVSVGAVHRRP